jgi:hypothetical protein
MLITLIISFILGSYKFRFVHDLLSIISTEQYRVLKNKLGYFYLETKIRKGTLEVNKEQWGNVKGDSYRYMNGFLSITCQDSCKASLGFHYNL